MQNSNFSDITLSQLRRLTSLLSRALFRRFFKENEQSPAVFLSPRLTYKRPLTVHSHITVFTEFLTSGRNPFLQHRSSNSSTISMATSSETPSGADQTATSGLLGIKANQILILDLDPSKYDAFPQPLIKCMKYSLLLISLSKTENVLLAFLSKAYCYICYEENGPIIIFEVDSSRPPSPRHVSADS